MNTKISVFVICIEAVIDMLLHNLHDCTFKSNLEFPGLIKKNHVEFPGVLVLALGLKISKGFGNNTINFKKYK